MMIKKNFQKMFSAVMLLFLIFNSTLSYSQQINVTGKVTDKDDGATLPGVSVKVKGSSAGTSTNSQGTFILNAEPNAILIFSYVGYDQIEVPLNGQRNGNWVWYHN
jgi:hypothetical protein